MPITRRRIETLVAALVAVAAGIVGIANREAARSLGPKFVTVERIARLKNPVFLTQPPGPGSQLYVVQAGGAVRVIANDRLLKRPFLNIADRVEAHGVRSEPGMVSIAFSPDYPTSGLFYVAYTDRRDGLVVAQYRREARQSPGRRSGLGPDDSADPRADPRPPRRPARLRARWASLHRNRGRRAAPRSEEARAGLEPPARQGPAHRPHLGRLRDSGRQPVRRPPRPRRDLVVRTPKSAWALLRPGHPDRRDRRHRGGPLRGDRLPADRQVARSELRLVGLRGLRPVQRRGPAARHRAPRHRLPASARLPGRRRLSSSGIRASPGSGDARSSATTSSATTAPAKLYGFRPRAGRRAGKQRSFRLGTRYLTSIGEDNSRRIYILTLRGPTRKGKATLGSIYRLVPHRNPVQG